MMPACGRGATADASRGPRGPRRLGYSAPIVTRTESLTVMPSALKPGSSTNTCWWKRWNARLMLSGTGSRNCARPWLPRTNSTASIDARAKQPGMP